MEGSYGDFVSKPEDWSYSYYLEEDDRCDLEQDAWLWNAVILDAVDLPDVNSSQLTEVINLSGSQIASISRPAPSSPLKRKRVSTPLLGTNFITTRPAGAGNGSISYSTHDVSTREEFEQLKRWLFKRDENFSHFQQKCMPEAFQNQDKNRNAFDWPYTHTLCRNFCCSNDYINASKLPDGTILAQPPCSLTSSYFWSMVFAMEIRCIYSTAKNEPSNDYFPEKQKPFNDDALTVTRHEQEPLIKETSSTKWTIRYFVKEENGTLLDAKELYLKCQDLACYSKSKPLLIISDSCISGNGMLLAICFYLYQLHQEHKKSDKVAYINLPNLVAYFRSYIRFGMVQNHDEYLVLHQFLVFLQDFEKRS